MTLSQTINKVIELGRDVREYYETELPKYHREYPLILEGEDEPPSPPSEVELQAFFESLPEDMLYQVLLIMHLGREDFGVDDLAEQFQEWKSSGTREYAMPQLMGYAPLADELEDGLGVLGKHNIHVDKILWKRAKVKKR